MCSSDLCQYGVSGFTTLGNEYADIVAEDRCLAVEEVRRELNADRDFGQLFKDGPRSDARMVASAARRENDATSTADDGKICAETTEGDLIVIKVDTTTHCVDNRFGLLEDLLLHEMGELALHDFGYLDLERFEAASGGGLFAVTTEAVNMELSICDVSNVIVFKIENTFGVLNDCGSVRCDKEFDGLGKTIL